MVQALPVELQVLVGSYVLDATGFFRMHRSLGGSSVRISAEHKANFLEHSRWRGETQYALEHSAKHGALDVAEVLIERVERADRCKDVPTCVERTRRAEPPSVEQAVRLAARSCCRTTQGCQVKELDEPCGCLWYGAKSSPECMGGRALHLAITRGHLDVARMLILRMRHRIYECPQFGLATVTAAKEGHGGLLDDLLRRYAEDPTCTPEQRCLHTVFFSEALWHAVFNGHAEIVRKLLLSPFVRWSIISVVRLLVIARVLDNADVEDALLSTIAFD